MQGGYMAAKVSKLDEQFKLNATREKQKEGTSSSIFSGVAIYVNGYTGNTTCKCFVCTFYIVNSPLYHFYWLFISSQFAALTKLTFFFIGEQTTFYPCFLNIKNLD